MNTRIQTTLVSLGQVAGLNNVIDELTETLVGLCKTYIPGIPNVKKGLRPIESEDVPVNTIMIQFLNVAPNMKTTAKYEKFYVFDFWYIIGDDSVDECMVKATDLAEIFMKLFSNNALNDQGQVANTNKYKTNGSQWQDSEMTRVECTVPFVLGRPNTSKYVSLGNFQLRIQTVKLV
jgi:hypothetical protein